MKKTTSFLLKKYARMSGDEKIRLGLSLSQAVRNVRQDGIRFAKSQHGRKRSGITS